METKKAIQANTFEEKVYDYFNDILNISLSHYVTKDGQHKRGENRQGVEIKNDQLFRKTGNLYIATKRVYDFADYPSGIFRETSTKQLFYVIGDEQTFWVISTKHLQEYYTMNDVKLFDGFVTLIGGVEKGFLLPIKKADLMAVAKYDTQQKIEF